MKEYIAILNSFWSLANALLLAHAYHKINVTRFWKTDHIVMREINRISMFMHL